MLLLPTSNISIKPHQIMQIDYKDEPVPGIEFFLNKDLRKQLEIHDDASSIFCYEYVPERISRVI